MPQATDKPGANGSCHEHSEIQNLLLPKNLAGKTAIVTGSSRCIGAGIALELGKRGARVIVNHSSKTSAESGAKVVKAIKAAGSEAGRVHASAISTSDIKKIIVAATGLSLDGKTDILAWRRLLLGRYNGGILHHSIGYKLGRYGIVTESHITHLLKLETHSVSSGPIFLTQAAMSHFNGGGRIVIISSVSAHMGVPQQTVYAVTKAALEALVRVWATELGVKYGVTCNAVAPGPIATETYDATDQGFLDSMQPLINSTPAAHRVGDVSDVVPIVA